MVRSSGRHGPRSKFVGARKTSTQESYQSLKHPRKSIRKNHLPSPYSHQKIPHSHLATVWLPTFVHSPTLASSPTHRAYYH